MYRLINLSGDEKVHVANERTNEQTNERTEGQTGKNNRIYEQSLVFLSLKCYVVEPEDTNLDERFLVGVTLYACSLLSQKYIIDSELRLNVRGKRF